MPLYLYRCEKCDSFFEKSHSIKENINLCDLCGEKDCVSRVPQIPNVSICSEKTEKKKVGVTTEKFIEEAREELKQQKAEMEEKRGKK